MAAADQLTQAIDEALRYVKGHQLEQRDSECARLVYQLKVIRFPSLSRTRAAERLLAKVERVKLGLEDIPFLPAPAGALPRAGLPVGVQDADQQLVRLPLRNTIIYGSTGMGKTVVKQVLLVGAQHAGLKIVGLDPKDDDRHLAVRDPRWLVFHPNFPWNPLQRVPYLDVNAQVAITTACFTRAFYGAEHQRQVINEALHRVYMQHEHPCIADLSQAITGLHQKGDTYARVEAIRSGAARTQRVIEQYTGLAKRRWGVPVATLADFSIHFGMAVHSDVAEFLHALLTWHLFLRNRYLQIRHPSYVISVDESLLAHNATQQRLEESSITTLAAMGREFGFINLWTTLNASMTSALLKSASVNHLAVPSTEGTDAREIARILGLTDRQSQYYVMKLRVGQGILKLGAQPDGTGYTEPFLLRLPPPVTDDKSVSLAAWKDAEQRAESLIPPAPAPVHVSPERTLPPERPVIALNANARKLLTAICDEPAMWSSYYYTKCSIHFQTGDRVRARLKALGLVQIEKMTIHPRRGGAAIGVRATGAGYSLLNRKAPHGTRGGDSIQHEHLARRIARLPSASLEVLLKTKSVDVVIPFNNDAHADLVRILKEHGIALAPTIALNNGDLIGIEVESSKPEISAVRNVEANHGVGIALHVIAVLPKLEQPTVSALRASLSETLYPRVLVINALQLLHELEE